MPQSTCDGTVSDSHQTNVQDQIHNSRGFVRCGAACTAAVKLANLARSGDLSERQDPAASCARRRALTTHSQRQPRENCVLYLNLQCPSY